VCPVTVDPPTLCFVAILKVESKELELELDTYVLYMCMREYIRERCAQEDLCVYVYVHISCRYVCVLYLCICVKGPYI